MPKKCCVPGCRSNYDGEKKRVSVFTFPKDVERKTLWLNKIPRANFVPSNGSVVCAKHFSEKFIVWVDSAIRPDGSVLSVKRQYPKLAHDAFPSYFPNCPEPPTKRKKPGVRRLEAQVTMPKKIPAALAESLILAIQKRECLYDRTKPSYKNRNVSEVAWRDVADELKRDVASCKALWASLRATFNRNLANTKQPKWPFFSQMLFLKQHVSHGHMFSNMAAETIESHAKQSETLAEQLAEPQADPQGGPQAESRVEPQAKSRVEPQAEPHVEPQAEPHVEPQAEPHVEPKAEPITEPNPGSQEELNFELMDTQDPDSDVSSLGAEDVSVVSDTSVVAASTKGKAKKRKADRDPVQSALLTYIQNMHHREQQEDKNLAFFKALLPYFNSLPPVQQLRYIHQITKILSEMVAANNNTMVSS